jgi:hypothetical protein
MHTDAPSARTPARRESSIVPALLAGIVLAYVVVGFALYGILSAVM